MYVCSKKFFQQKWGLCETLFFKNCKMAKFHLHFLWNLRWLSSFHRLFFYRSQNEREKMYKNRAHTVRKCFYSTWYCGLSSRANIDILQTSLYNNVTSQRGNKLNDEFAVWFWFLSVLTWNSWIQFRWTKWKSMFGLTFFLPNLSKEGHNGTRK